MHAKIANRAAVAEIIVVEICGPVFT